METQVQDSKRGEWRGGERMHAETHDAAVTTPLVIPKAEHNLPLPKAAGLGPSAPHCRQNFASKREGK